MVESEMHRTFIISGMGTLSKKCGGGYKVRCKMQDCASTNDITTSDYGNAKLKALLDPCDPENKDKQQKWRNTF